MRLTFEELIQKISADNFLCIIIEFVFKMNFNKEKKTFKIVEVIDMCLNFLKKQNNFSKTFLYQPDQIIEGNEKIIFGLLNHLMQYHQEYILKIL